MLEKTLKLLAQVAPGTYVDSQTEVFYKAELTELAKLLRPLLYAPSHLRAYLKILSPFPVSFSRKIPQ